MKKFTFFLQLIGIFIMVLIPIMIIPNQIKTLKTENYLKKEVQPKLNDYNEYLPIISSLNDVVYKKDPLFNINFKDNNHSINLVGFLTTSVNLEKNVDSIYIFINGATYHNKDYKELSLTVEYDKIVNENSYSFSPAISTNGEILQGFYATQIVLDNDSIAKIKSLSFGIMINKNVFTSKFLLISSDKESASDYIFSSTFAENNIDLENINISSKIASTNNIPTNSEMEQYNLGYSKFDSSIINSYYRLGWLWYLWYIIMLIPIVYFGYIRGLLKLKKSLPSKN